MKNQQTPNPDRIIPRDEFRKLTDISRATEWRYRQKGLLPAAVVIDGRILGYRASEYAKWLSANAA